MNLKTGVSRKESTPNFLKNEHFLPPDTHTCVCVTEGKKCLFFGKFGVLCLLETPVLRLALLAYYRRILKKTASEVMSMHKHYRDNKTAAVDLTNLTNIDTRLNFLFN